MLLTVPTTGLYRPQMLVLGLSASQDMFKWCTVPASARKIPISSIKSHVSRSSGSSGCRHSVEQG